MHSTARLGARHPGLLAIFGDGKLSRWRSVAPTQALGAHKHAIVYSEDFRINPIPDNHRFPMPKDFLLFRRLQEQGLASRVFRPTHPDADTLCLIHDRAYVEGFLQGSISTQDMRRIGLPWSQPLVQRTLAGVGSAILAARLALQYGVACMTNGGTHHAHSDHGSGWCIFNDQAVAAKACQRDAGIERCMFVDLDVHQGDGTAAIFADDPSVFTLSLHCEAQSYPSELQQSSLDVPLPAGCTDEEYLEVLLNVLPKALAEFKPELVLYNAGTDVHAEDSLGKMALSTHGILRRDRFVMQSCLMAGVPVAAAIGGGYDAGGNHEKIVDRHMMLHQAASEFAEAMLSTTKLGGKGEQVER